MNREQRRKAAKRTSSSERRFTTARVKKIPINMIKSNPDLKECDPEVLELISKRFTWAEKGLVKNDLSKCIIMLGCDYLDSLCSLRFDIISMADKALVCNMMCRVGNYVNLFYGLMLNEESENETLSELSKRHMDNGETGMKASIVHPLYPINQLPNEQSSYDRYTNIVLGHGEELSTYLHNVRKSDITGDEEYVFEVLNMILKKTDELLPEAQAN